MVLRLLAGFSKYDGEWDRDKREVTDALWCEVADDWRAFLAICLLAKLALKSGAKREIGVDVLE